MHMHLNIFYQTNVDVHLDVVEPNFHLKLLPPDVASGSPNDDEHGVEHDAAEHDCRVTDHQLGLHHMISNLT